MEACCGVPLEAPYKGRAQREADSLHTAGHLDFDESGMVRDTSRGPCRLEAAPMVERDRGLVAGGNPEVETKRSACACPANNGLDQRDTNTTPACYTVNKHANEYRL